MRIFVLLAAPSVALAVPLVLSHAGRVLDASGVPVDGVRPVVFGLHASETGGADWSEPWSIAFADGYYAVRLGSVTTLDASDLAGPEVWLSVAVDGAELLPRTRLASVPFAVTAGTLAPGSVVDASEIRIDGAPLVEVVGTTPRTNLTLTGSIELGDDPDDCDGDAEGRLKWDGTDLRFCDGSGDWKSIAFGPERGTEDNPWDSAAEIRAANAMHATDGSAALYWIDVKGTAKQVWCRFDAGRSLMLLNSYGASHPLDGGAIGESGDIPGFYSNAVQGHTTVLDSGSSMSSLGYPSNGTGFGQFTRDRMMTWHYMRAYNGYNCSGQTNQWMGDTAFVNGNCGDGWAINQASGSGGQYWWGHSSNLGEVHVYGTFADWNAEWGPGGDWPVDKVLVHIDINPSTCTENNLAVNGLGATVFGPNASGEYGASASAAWDTNPANVDHGYWREGCGGTTRLYDIWIGD